MISVMSIYICEWDYVLVFFLFVWVVSEWGLYPSTFFSMGLCPSVFLVGSVNRFTYATAHLNLLIHSYGLRGQLASCANLLCRF